MSSYLTTDSLIESVKRRASIPESQVTFQDSDFLAFANEEIAIGLLPVIMQFHEEFFVYDKEIPLVANKSAYSIPSRAVGSKLRSIFYKDSSGNLQEMARIQPEDIMYFRSAGSGNQYNQYYIQNNTVVLAQDVGASPSGSLLMYYYMRPNQLVAESRVSVITAIDTVTGVITVDTVPSVFSSSSTFDLIEANGAHRTKALDLSASNVNSSSGMITFDADDLPSDLEVGDHINLSGESVIPQMPDDLHSVLAQRVAARCLESLGDQAGLQSANAKLTEMELKMGNLIDNRTENNPPKVNNLRGILRQGRQYSRRRF